MLEAILSSSSRKRESQLQEAARKSRRGGPSQPTAIQGEAMRDGTHLERNREKSAEVGECSRLKGVKIIRNAYNCTTLG